MDVWILIFSLMIALLAGTVKGIVGFAMPMVMISGLSSVIAPELALAGLILPTLVANSMQAMRQGAQAAWQTICQFRVFLLTGLVFLVMSSQLVRVLPGQTLVLIIGIFVFVFSLIQLLGATLTLTKRDTRLDLGLGGIAGFIGGMSGIWGPPTVLYLTALGIQKAEHLRIQGVVYCLGAMALTGSHITSGVLNAANWWFSAALILPGMAGMWIGGRISDRLPQAIFRKATLWVLLIAAANLIRKGVFG